jgi:phosphate transport system substrate-binding protein
MTKSVSMRNKWPYLVIIASITLPSGCLLSAQTSLTGAGATFPAPIYQTWFSQYQTVGNVQINYQPIGSGGGIRGVTEGTIDFRASDMPMTDQQLKEFKDKHGFDVKLFPTVLGAVVPTYNVPGLSQDLNFTPEALAGIFLGKITQWNDPDIAKANPGVKLPGNRIVVMHRSDGSGTTYCWTDYLSKVSPEWSSKVGKNTSVSWPTGLGAKGNDGVAGLIKQQKGSLGETAPLLFTALGNMFWSQGWLQPIATLPVMIYNYAIAPEEDLHQQAWAAGFVLLALVLLINVTARMIVARGSASFRR